MAARLTGIPDWQFFDTTGAVLAGGKVYFYAPGTTDAKDIYDDTDKATTLSNPVVLDSSGRVPFPVYAEGIYDVVVKTSADVTVDTIANWGDDWSAVGTDLSENLISNASFETAGTGSEAVANWTETDPGALITRDTSDSYHGGACLKFTNSQNSEEDIVSDVIEISPGRDVMLSGYVKASNASAQPSWQLNWLTAAQAYISTSTVYLADDGITPTSWTWVTGFTASPPATARYVAVNIVGNASPTQYTTQYDGMRLRQLSTVLDDPPLGKPHGFELSLHTDTSHDIKITAGSVKDANGVIYYRAEDIVKQMDAAFAVSSDDTPAGGAESGFSIPADGVVFLHLIKDTDTGHTDVLFSNSATAPTLPSGYDASKYLGCAKTDASNNLTSQEWSGIHCTQTGDLTDDFSDGTLTNATFETGTLNAPPEALVDVHVKGLASGTDYQGESFVMYRPTASSAASFIQVGIDINDLAGGEIDHVDDVITVRTDASQQIDYSLRFSNTSTDPTVYFRTAEWDDLRRDQP